MSSRAAGAGLLVVLLVAGSAPAEQPGSDLEVERERLIEQLISGERFEQGVKAYRALVARRDATVPTSFTAKRKAQERLAAVRAWSEQWRKTADSEVAWRCRLAADPKNPPPSDGWAGDWGKVVKKEQVRLAPKNELDEGELWTLYEVQGQRRSYRFRDKGFTVFRRPAFEAFVGDLVLVCDGGVTTEAKLPLGWRENFQRSGFAVRLQHPPKVAQKLRWNPIHITETTLFWAAREVKWKFPPEAHVLAVVELGEQLGPERWRIQLQQGERAVVEVPSGLPNRELLVQGQKAWAIMGKARFDKELKALVLQVVDLEPRYVEEPGEDD